MGQPNTYLVGIDYPYLGEIPNIPLGTRLEMILVCGTRIEMKHTQDNKACWFPRIYDPSIEGFRILSYPNQQSSTDGDSQVNNL